MAQQHSLVKVLIVVFLIAFAITLALATIGFDCGKGRGAAGPVRADAAVGSLSTDASGAAPADLLGDYAHNARSDQYADVGSGISSTFLPDTSSVDKRAHCGTAAMEKWHTNAVGWRLFTVRTKIYFCVRRGLITYKAPHTDVEINTAGTVGQWHKDYGTVYKHWFPWRRGRLHSGYSYTKTVHFSRQLCPPLLGCLTVGSARISTHLRLHGDGSYWRG